ncbi:terpene synthase 10-like [Zingiber officinale]|uniref:terpene synthase 10-like n=1 Tax=Zingiber officinale TaxID=94328 RepID=UPI001C4B8D1B|nr:terpene synthase 10-like [Zingiber officinale]
MKQQEACLCSLVNNGSWSGVDVDVTSGRKSNDDKTINGDNNECDIVVVREECSDDKASATFGSRGDLGGFSRPATAIKQWRCLPRIQCHTTEQSQSPSTTLRRSGNYQPSIWTHERIQSLTLSHTADEDDQAERIKLLKNQTSKLMEEKKGQLEEQLQLIDHLQQLGVAYHFKDEIKDTLRGFHASFGDIGSQLKDNLHASALLFRLLRENGFSVSEDIFKKFKDEKGQFEDRLRSQAHGLLSLYEASYLEKDGEELLHEAREFTTKHLKNLLEEERSLKPGLIREQVAHALELPLNWRFQRLHTKWFIGAWQRDPAMDPALLLLAKLDFNALQNIYKRELREVSRWWTDLGLPQKLPFFRDRLTENYLWTVGWAMEPDCWAFRELQTKTNCFITMIDDVYDVYGTLDELELFTDIMER